MKVGKMLQDSLNSFRISTAFQKISSSMKFKRSECINLNSGIWERSLSCIRLIKNLELDLGS